MSKYSTSLNLSKNFFDHYYLFASRHDGVLGANLTITEVSKDDFDRKFVCELFSTQAIDGQTTVSTTLVQSVGRPRGLVFYKLITGDRVIN